MGSDKAARACNRYHHHDEGLLGGGAHAVIVWAYGQV